MFYEKRCSLRFRKFRTKTPVLESLFNKVARLKTCQFIKRRLKHNCFPMKFATFLRTPIFEKHLRTTAFGGWKGISYWITNWWERTPKRLLITGLINELRNRRYSWVVAEIFQENKKTVIEICISYLSLSGCDFCYIILKLKLPSLPRKKKE